MGKAFQCDNCGECYTGYPEMTDNNGNDFCANCVRVMRAFSTIDPFSVKCSDNEKNYKFEKECKRNAE